MTALAGGLMACAVGSSVALPSSIIPQVMEEEMVPDFDTGSWIGQLIASLCSVIVFLFQLQAIFMLLFLQVYLGDF